MAWRKINDSLLSEIADEIRAKTGNTASLTPAQMSAELSAIETKKPEQTKTVTAGTSAVTVNPDIGKVLSGVTVNPTPSQAKSVTPSASAQTVLPDSGKLLSSVSVNAVNSDLLAALDSDFNADNIKQGVNILGLTGNLAVGIPNLKIWKVIVPSDKTSGNFYFLNSDSWLLANRDNATLTCFLFPAATLDYSSLGKGYIGGIFCSNQLICTDNNGNNYGFAIKVSPSGGRGSSYLNQPLNANDSAIGQLYIHTDGKPAVRVGSTYPLLAGNYYFVCYYQEE